MCVCACVRAESESTYEFSSGRSLSDTLCPVEPYRMPHKVRHAIPYDDQTGVDRIGWGASLMQGGQEKGERGARQPRSRPQRKKGKEGRTASPAQYAGGINR